MIITLGTNALQHRRPDRYARWVRALVKQVGPRSCYWIGPPPLLEDRRGFNGMLSESTRPCRYFDSRVIGAPPRADGKFHLTRSEGLAWARLIWRWMNGEYVQSDAL
ncbi:MAG: hypothetical protein JRI23_04455 [Deltaproteobacteria bacterium]|nr:hypothetical protein [Deltaproteobacteria bacterium]MBW2530795.1 hypothetical protein [Deltaproteobacteria bacterium]